MPTRAGWNCAAEGSGERCVTTPGITQMLVLSAVNWTIPRKVREAHCSQSGQVAGNYTNYLIQELLLFLLHTLGQELAPFWSVMSTAGEQR